MLKRDIESDGLLLRVMHRGGMLLNVVENGAKGSGGWRLRLHGGRWMSRWRIVVLGDGGSRCIVEEMEGIFLVIFES